MMKLTRVEKNVTKKLGMSTRSAKKACKVVRKFGYDAAVSAAGELIVIGVCTTCNMVKDATVTVANLSVSGCKKLFSKAEAEEEDEVCIVDADDVEA